MRQGVREDPGGGGMNNVTEACKDMEEELPRQGQQPLKGMSLACGKGEQENQRMR